MGSEGPDMGSDHPSRKRRRRLIVDKQVQTKVMLQAALLPFLALVTNTVVVCSICWSLVEEASAADVALPSAFNLIIASGVFLLASALFLGYYVLIISHRIAGPMYRMDKTMESFQNGDRQSRATCRRHDTLAPLADNLNAFLDWVEQEIGDPEVVEADAGDETPAESPEPAAANA